MGVDVLGGRSRMFMDLVEQRILFVVTGIVRLDEFVLLRAIS